MIKINKHCSHLVMIDISHFGHFYWPAPPHDPQGIRVASGFEFSACVFVCLFVCLSVSLSVCLLVCLLVLGKFSNLFVHYKAAGVRKNIVRMNTDVPCRRLDQIEI